MFSKSSDFKDKKVVVMGLGLHGGGVGAVKWLARQKAKILVTDLRSRKELEPSLIELKNIKNIEYVFGEHRSEDFKKVDLIIKNPAVPLDSRFIEIANKNKISITDEMSLFFDLCPNKIIGITGSKGKTTITTLLGKIFTKNNPNTVIAGNIRISALESLKKIKENSDIILELSSWQMEYLEKSPSIAVISNILLDHLNRHKNLNGYIQAKKKIMQYQTKEDIVVLNYDDPRTMKLAGYAKGRVFWFSKKYLKSKSGTFVENEQIVFQDNENGEKEIVCEVKDVKLPGLHNLENILATITVAKIKNLSDDLIARCVKNFKKVEGRLELVRSFQGVKYYNDTTATIPEATISALQSFSSIKKIILIAGGADKKLDFVEFAKESKEVKKIILLPGNATDKMIIELKKKKIDYFAAENMNRAVELAASLAESGDIVLMSPGATSFAQFLNEFVRGDKFVQAVQALKI